MATRIGAGSVVVRNVENDCTVVGIPGRVIHKSGTRIDPLAHSALPDAEATIIKNLMKRIDKLETQLESAVKDLSDIRIGNPCGNQISGYSQNLQDKEIIDLLGSREDDIVNEQIS